MVLHKQLLQLHQPAATMHVRSKSFRPRKIDPFKQLQVIRSEDELVFEDEAGHVHHATNADLASGVRACTTTHSLHPWPLSQLAAKLANGGKRAELYDLLTDTHRLAWLFGLAG